MWSVLVYDLQISTDESTVILNTQVTPVKHLSCLWTFHGTSPWRETQSSYSLEAFITVTSGSSTRKKRLTGTKREVNFPASVGKLVGYPLVLQWYQQSPCDQTKCGTTDRIWEDTRGDWRYMWYQSFVLCHFLLPLIFIPQQDKLGWHSKSRISQSLSLFCLLSGEWFFNAVTHCSICLCIIYL